VNVSVPFVKMSGAGNDFIVVDQRVWEGLPAPRSSWVRGVCRRGVSVGADGVLVVGPAGAGRVGVTFFNPDGGEAFCGNGSRCAARYAFAKGLASGRSMTLRTAVGDVPAEIVEAGVTLTLPPPQDRGATTLRLADGEVAGRFVLAGVPHIVIPVERLSTYPLDRAGPMLRRHPALGPDGANVDLVEGDDLGRVHVRTFERGVEGETLACGTGAVAAAFAARIDGAPESITVVPRSGIELRVDLPGDRHRPDAVRLSGDARFVFDGLLSAEGILETA
jgi:diaminopimelate epimerase